MMIKTPAPDRAQPSTLKVLLPLDLHLKLHALRIVSGQTISATTTAALEAYFASAPNESRSVSAQA